MEGISAKSISNAQAYTKTILRNIEDNKRNLVSLIDCTVIIRVVIHIEHVPATANSGHYGVQFRESKRKPQRAWAEVEQAKLRRSCKSQKVWVKAIGQANKEQAGNQCQGEQKNIQKV